MPRFTRLLLVGMLLLTLFFLSLGGTAFAASSNHALPAITCASNPTEANCTGQDPVAQGCQNDAYTVISVLIKNAAGGTMGEVDLRYSPTCNSNWSRIIRNTNTGPINQGDAAWVIRPAQTVNGVYYPYEKFITPTQLADYYTLYSDMVFAPGAVTAQACGSMEMFQNCTKAV